MLAWIWVGKGVRYVAWCADALQGMQGNSLLHMKGFANSQV